MDPGSEARRIASLQPTISGTTHLRPPQAAGEVDYVALQKQAANRRYRRRRDRLILRQRIR
jgi:hypothetical protein